MVALKKATAASSSSLSTSSSTFSLPPRWPTWLGMSRIRDLRGRIWCLHDWIYWFPSSNGRGSVVTGGGWLRRCCQSGHGARLPRLEGHRIQVLWAWILRPRPWMRSHDARGSPGGGLPLPEQATVLLASRRRQPPLRWLRNGSARLLLLRRRRQAGPGSMRAWGSSYGASPWVQAQLQGSAMGLGRGDPELGCGTCCACRAASLWQLPAVGRCC